MLFRSANGMESTDLSSDNFNFSYNLSVHIKPKNGMRVMVGYNKDFLPTNSMGSHAHSMANLNSSFDKAINIDQFHFSVAHFESNFEFLNEFAAVITNTDSLGISLNYTNYLYSGYRIKDKYVPYVLVDFLLTSENELHTKLINALKYSIGFKWDFTPMINMKCQIERYGSLKGFENLPRLNDKYEFKLQLSYAI